MKKIIALCAAILLLSAQGLAAADKNPHMKPNNSWIRISGTVTSVTPNAFELDYGSGQITVEMDDWDWYEEGRVLRDGDKVTVNGFIDDDLYEKSKIEASSVYVKDLNTYFYASGADEEDFAYVSFMRVPVVDYPLQYTGTVTEVNGREFTLDTGLRKIVVDTDSLPYNPMDDKGYQQIDEGDRVTLAGHWDYDLFERREIKPEWIVTLIDDDA